MALKRSIGKYKENMVYFVDTSHEGPRYRDPLN